jgi:hypothetical protein
MSSLIVKGEPTSVSYSDDKGIRREPIKYEVLRQNIGDTPGAEIALKFC